VGHDHRVSASDEPDFGDLSPLRPLGSSLERVVGALTGSGTAGTQVFSVWAEVVGPAIAAHARPVSLRSGVLVIAVEDGRWASELRFLTARLAAQLNDALGTTAVREVVVKVKPAEPA
jgi:predicted nucleic acid-binding Zn ribbon protein